MTLTESYGYYEALAEKIVFEGIKADDIQQIARYRNGKSWRDLKEAIEQAKLIAIGRSTKVLFEGLSLNLEKVLEIDTSIPLNRFNSRLRTLQAVTSNSI